MIGELQVWTDEATGLRCAYRVNEIAPVLTIRCGYVEVPVRHPMHGWAYDVADYHVAEELTFGGVPPGAPADSSWWFGIDDNGDEDEQRMRARVTALAAEIAGLA